MRGRFARERSHNVRRASFRLNEAADAGVAGRGTLMLPSFSPAE